MLKNFFLVITILLFCTNVIAEEIIMKCKNYLYKYVADSSGVSIYASNIKRDKKKYHKFCPSEVRDDNKHFLISAEGTEMIITDKKITCLTAKGVLKSGVVTASEPNEQKRPKNSTTSSQEKAALRSIVDELQALRKLLSNVLDK